MRKDARYTLRNRPGRFSLRSGLNPRSGGS